MWRTRSEHLSLVLRLAAPYLAVAVFWCALENAWLTILAYHAQVLVWARGGRPSVPRPKLTPWALLVLPSALAGPALYLLPHIARVDLGAWLGRYDLTGPSLIAMAFYFGLVHPLLEQIHWAPLRERTRAAHAAFAGYHLLVLWALLPVPWLVVCFAVLSAASWLWQQMTHASGSLLSAVASQAVADIGIVLVAVLTVSNGH